MKTVRNPRRGGPAGLLVVLILAGCVGQRAPTAAPPVLEQPAPRQPAPSEAACPLCGDPASPEIRAAYAAAVEDAKYPAPEKISRELTPLLGSTEGLSWDDQGRILMATWTKAAYYSDPETYQRGKAFSLYGDTWFTAVPRVRDFCRALDLDAAMRKLRLEQRFGLPPGGNKDAFVEVWVDPADLFRPCPDPGISDTQCQVEIPVKGRVSQDGVSQDGAGEPRKPWDCTGERQVSGRYVTVDSDHLQWMCYNWTLSYGNDDPLENYPWTALGYTYDWGHPDDPRGLSEYVAPGKSQVVFESLTPTELYCSGPSGE